MILHFDRRRSAFALITVMAMTTLVTVLILAVLQSGRSELQASYVVSRAVELEDIKNTAANLIIAQIRAATDQPGEFTERRAWASQPGAIRVYGADGDFAGGFKLYSDDTMRTGTEAELVGDRLPADWDSADNGAHFVDLNEPSVRLDPTTGGQEIHFPIVDPRAAFDDPGTAPDDRVEGFSFDESAVRGAVKSGSSDDFRLPMPVRWLYLLKDGAVGHLGGDNEFIGAQPATAENPIVGRVAFWADDETSKLNVNTASEPTPWDTPRSTNKADFDYGRYQPARNEYQRYPGHPYMTALSPVLFPGIPLGSAEKELIYGIVPRVVPGGTVGETRSADAALQPDSDRLYANIDELLFRPDREENDLIDERTLGRGRFFLTSQSRAPEITSFGTPRVAIWPVGGPGFTRTAFDELVAFCATAGGKPYYFQRIDAVSATRDWTEISRNRELFSYLRGLTSLPIPGVGKSFANKWAQDRDQVLTEAFDYVRCTNLSDSLTGAQSFAARGQVTPIRLETEKTKGFGRFLSVSEYALHFIAKGDGKEGGRGAKDPDGSDLTENERVIQCALLVEPFSVSPAWVPIYEDLTVRVSGLEGFRVDGKNMEFPAEPLDLPITRTGYYTGWHGVPWGTSYGVRVSIGARGNGYPFLSGDVVVNATGDNPTMSFTGGTLNVEVFRGNSHDPEHLVQTMEIHFPPENFPIPSLPEEGTGVYRGADTTEKDWWWQFGNRYSHTVWHRPHAPGPEYSENTRRWPPDVSGNPSGFMAGGVFRKEDVVRSVVPYHGDMRLVAGLQHVGKRPGGQWIFVPHAYYDDPLRNVDHLISEAMGPHMVYGFSNEPGLNPHLNPAGQLTPNPSPDPLDQLTPGNYHWSKLPDVPKRTGRLNLWGDFDNGVAQVGDGAFINKPDEGNMNSLKGYPYFHWAFALPTEVHFSPNRIANSPGIFGSLPTGVQRDQPWQTLLFRRQPGHPGGEAPADHHFLDLFWMPVIEPYAISEPFSTAGKVNLNHEILPFTYITRSTALRGLLKSEEMLTVPNSMSKAYKLFDHETSDWPWNPDEPRGNLDGDVLDQWVELRDGKVHLRVPIHADETLAQFRERFDRGEIFRSESEICDVHLVPDMLGTERPDEQPVGGADPDALDLAMDAFWKNHVVTGENSREKPYSNLYSRLTTRSNTFRVHLRAQVINKARSTDPAVFDAGRDQVAAEYRGSAVIERFIEPDAAGVPDYGTEEDAVPLDHFYKFRVLEDSRFAP